MAMGELGMRVRYDEDSLRYLYDALHADAIIIIPVSQTRSLTHNGFIFYDIAYDLAAHFHELYGSPLLTRANLTAYKSNMQHAIVYAVRCQRVLQDWKKYGGTHIERLQHGNTPAKRKNYRYKKSRTEV